MPQIDFTRNLKNLAGTEPLMRNLTADEIEQQQKEFLRKKPADVPAPAAAEQDALTPVLAEASQILKEAAGEAVKTAAPEYPFPTRVPCTLSYVAVSVLMAPNATGGKEKLERFQLAREIYNAKEPVKLKAEQITVIKDAIGSSEWPPLVAGQALDMLDE
jgi:hypothetical protein